MVAARAVSGEEAEAEVEEVLDLVRGGGNGQVVAGSVNCQDLTGNPDCKPDCNPARLTGPGNLDCNPD